MQYTSLNLCKLGENLLQIEYYLTEHNIAHKLNNDWNTSQYWSTEIGILMMDDIKYFEGTKMNIYTSERASDWIKCLWEAPNMMV